MTIEAPLALSIAVWVIVALLAAIAWFLRRELNSNDAAHKDLGKRIDSVGSDVKQLLVQVGVLTGRSSRDTT